MQALPSEPSPNKASLKRTEPSQKQRCPLLSFNDGCTGEYLSGYMSITTSIIVFGILVLLYSAYWYHSIHKYVNK